MRRILSGITAAALLVALFAATSCRVTGFSHKTHLGEVKGCVPCHGEDASSPAMPGGKECASCHEEGKKYSRGTFSWTKPASFEDSTFSHGTHAEAGIGCESCHTPGGVTGETMTLPRMEKCISCHEENSVGVDCETCHREIRKGKKPAFHGGGFLASHGQWEREGRGYCSSCHGEDGCETCHSRMKPASHRGAWNKSAHGVKASHDRERCALCHESGFCTRCHSTPPPSHAAPNFKFGGHERFARANSRSCLVCHERSFCASCH